MGQDCLVHVFYFLNNKLLSHLGNYSQVYSEIVELVCNVPINVKPWRGVGNIPTNWVSFARLLTEPIRSITLGWVFTRTSQNLPKILQKNLFPVHLVQNIIDHYLTLTRQDCYSLTSVSDTTRTFYLKLPYIGPFSIIKQKKVHHFPKRYCNNIDIKLVFSSFKIGNLFSVKDPIPRGLRTGVVYKFLCASCSACYVGETTLHFSMRIREHIFSIGPRTFLNMYKILNIAALYALMTVLAS